MRALALALAMSGTAWADGSCALTTASWSSAVSLRAAPDAGVFAKLRGWGKGPRATVALGAVMGASLSGDGLELHVIAEPGDWLHARGPLRFGKTVVASSGAPLRLRDAAALEVELPLPDAYTPAQPLRRTLRCEELAIDPPRLENLRSATGLPKKQRLAVLRGGVDIPLAAEPAGTPEGTLRASDEWPDVEVIKQSKGWTLIAADRSNAIIFGWVPSGFVQKPTEGDVMGGIMGGIGGLGLSGTGGAAPPRKKCATALRVFLRQRGRIGPEIGLLQPGTELIARANDLTWTNLTLPNLDWLMLEAGNELVVSSGDLARCDERSLDR